MEHLTFEKWLTFTERQQDDMVGYIQSRLGSEYRHVMTRSYSDNSALRIPTFFHLPSGMEFNLLFGGVFQMGFSEAEEQSVEPSDIWPRGLPVECMRPVHEVHVSPFLISRYPCTILQAQKSIYVDPEIARDADWCIWHEDGTRNVHYAMDLTHKEAEAIAERYGFSLPSEAQWEYACRGLTTTPFYFGNVLPRPEIIECELLLRVFFDPDLCLRAANPFGLVGLCVGEWCQDSYRQNYEDARKDDLSIPGPAPYIVRGGDAWGAWPWQCCSEEIYCMSAARFASEVSYPQTWSARFVKRLGRVS